MRSRIVGRMEECERLEDCLMADTAQLIVVYWNRKGNEYERMGVILRENRSSWQ